MECVRAREIENRDFIREDANPKRCWVDIASFRRNYPEIAEVTDLAATVTANMRDEPPLENWDGTTVGAVLRATAIDRTAEALAASPGPQCPHSITSSARARSKAG